MLLTWKKLYEKIICILFSGFSSFHFEKIFLFFYSSLKIGYLSADVRKESAEEQFNRVGPDAPADTVTFTADPGFFFSLNMKSGKNWYRLLALMAIKSSYLLPLFSPLKALNIICLAQAISDIFWTFAINSNGTPDSS